MFAVPRVRVAVRERVMPRVRSVVPQILGVFQHPVKLTQLLGGALLHCLRHQRVDDGVTLRPQRRESESIQVERCPSAAGPFGLRGRQHDQQLPLPYPCSGGLSLFW